MRVFLLLMALPVLAACASSQTLVRHKTEAHAANRSPEYQLGFSHGCTSGYAKSSIVVRADFTRDETRFRQNPEYASGWDEGRLACNFPGGSPTFLIGR